MGILEKLLVAGVAGIVAKGVSDGVKVGNEEKRRKNTPCKFTSELSEATFEEIAKQTIKEIEKSSHRSVWC